MLWSFLGHCQLSVIPVDAMGTGYFGSGRIGCDTHKDRLSVRSRFENIGNVAFTLYVCNLVVALEVKMKTCFF
jgi:hypothetical protein